MHRSNASPVSTTLALPSMAGRTRGGRAFAERALRLARMETRLRLSTLHPPQARGGQENGESKPHADTSREYRCLKIDPGRADSALARVLVPHSLAASVGSAAASVGATAASVGAAASIGANAKVGRFG